MAHVSPDSEPLALENARLTLRLGEAEETLFAIRTGAVDALIVNSEFGNRIFTLDGAEAPYRILIEEMNDGAVTLSADGTILFCNQGFQRLVKTPVERIVGAHLETFLAPDHDFSFVRVAARASAERYEQEVMIRAADGTDVPVRVSVNSLPSEFIGVLCLIVTDLTELKANERALLASAEALYARVGEQATMMGELRQARRAAVTMLEESVATGSALLVANRALEQEMRDRNAAEATRDRFEAQLRVKQKMEAIGTLASGIAHDFNNILSAIIGYVELARHDAHGQPTIVDALGEVLKASNRASALVRQILTIGRPEEHERQNMRLGPVVTEVISLLRAGIPSDISIDASLDPDASAVYADAAQVHQSLMNLGTNAAHALHGTHGALSFHVTNCTVDDADGDRLTDLRAGKYVRLSVSDTGAGMSVHTTERAFDPFFTTKAVGEGAGLGLSIVRGIMRAHDGDITVRSTLSVGTTFDLYFPAVARAVPESDIRNVTAPRGHGERILIVDDEATLGRLEKKVLERQGYEVVVAEHVADALTHVHDDPHRFDLIVTDYHMPGLLGTDLAQQIHAINPTIPVIMLSGNPAEVTADTVRSSGISEVLAKPISIDQLAHAVYRAIHATAPTEPERD